MPAFDDPSDEAILRQAEVLALRQMGDTMKRISDELQENRKNHGQTLEALGLIRQDIAVMKEQNKAMDALKTEQGEMDKRITALEALRQQMDGANNLVRWLREFGPWIVSLFVMAWALFKQQP